MIWSIRGGNGKAEEEGQLLAGGRWGVGRWNGSHLSACFLVQEARLAAAEAGRWGCRLKR